MDITVPHADVEIEEHADGINIYHLQVDPNYRREGIGSHVLDKVETLAKEHNKEYVVVNIKGGEESSQFLRENGYSIVDQLNSSITAEKEI